MDEATWLTSEVPLAMLEALQAGKASDRKLRLFVVACCSLQYRESPTAMPAFEVVERFADGKATLDEIRHHWLLGSADVFAWPERPYEWASNFLTWCPLEVEDDDAGYPPAIQLPPILRDIFGTPFQSRPAERDWLAWNNGAVTRLATVAYEKQALPAGHLDPGLLGILADTLEESGCHDAAILDHLRGPGPHWRGCHVVDWLLGKK